MKWNGFCPKCHYNFKDMNDVYNHQCKKEPKQMTRNEAIELVKKISHEKPYYVADVEILEALGLLKFEDHLAATYIIFELNNGCKLNQKLGTICLEEWPEGLVLWVGGEIKWKSWEKYYTKGDAAYFEYYNPEKADKQTQTGIVT